MAKQHVEQKISQPIGRHSVFRVKARFTIDGSPVDLSGDNYDAEAYLKFPDGTTAGPRSCTVEGEHAIYQLEEGDLENASTGSGSSGEHVELTIVAERTSPHTRLVSDRRVITVGDWAGADEFGSG